LAVGKIAAVHVRWDPVLAAHQGQPPVRVVPDGSDAGECDLAGRLPAHPDQPVLVSSTACSNGTLAMIGRHPVLTCCAASARVTTRGSVTPIVLP
jgi:hypothetical protein